MRSREATIKGLEADLDSRTGIHYTFRTRWVSPKSKKMEYHIIPLEPQDDDKFHLYRLCKFGVKWYRTPEQAVKAFMKERSHWLKNNKHRQVKDKYLASLPVSTQLPLVKAESALP